MQREQTINGEVTIRSLHTAAALIMAGEKLLRVAPGRNPQFADFIFEKSQTIFRAQDSYRDSELYTFYLTMQDLRTKGKQHVQSNRESE
jgi:hypothetical protein